jgi:acylphosphatase
MNLSKKHINYILGVSIPINESAYLSKDIKLNIIYEQILYETFLDSIKNYASEKYNQIVTNIKDWKDAAVIMGKVLSNADLLNDFLNPLQRQVENLFKPVTDFLKKQNLESWVEKIKEFFTKIKSLTGWKKFVSLVTLESIMVYITTKLSPEKIIKKLTSLFDPSSDILATITNKLADFKSYIGWLQPIVDGVEVIYEFLKPLIEKFKTALESGNKFATKLIRENMKTQQLRKLIRETILEVTAAPIPTDVANLTKIVKSNTSLVNALQKVDQAAEVTSFLEYILNTINPKITGVNTSALKTAIDNRFTKKV